MFVEGKGMQLGKITHLHHVPPHIHAKVTFACIACGLKLVVIPLLRHLRQPIWPTLNQYLDQRRVATRPEVI